MSPASLFPLDKRGETFGKLDAVTCLAFPDDEHTPTRPTKRGNTTSISNLGLLSLSLPEIRVCSWSASASFASVHVPEAAMYEDHTPVLGQDKIRGSGKLPMMESKSIAE